MATHYSPYLTVLPDGELYCCAYDSGLLSGKVYRSLDYGRSWAEILNNENAAAAPMSKPLFRFTPTQTGYVLIPAGGIWYSATGAKGTFAEVPYTCAPYQSPCRPTETGGYADLFCTRKDSLTGILTFTNGSVTVAGSGTAFTSELAVGDKIILDADEVWAKVSSIESDTSLTLTAAYSGTGGTGAGSQMLGLIVLATAWHRTTGGLRHSYFIYRSADGGATWTGVYHYLTASPYFLGKIRLRDSDWLRGFAFGACAFGMCCTTTTDGGINWGGPPIFIRAHGYGYRTPNIFGPYLGVNDNLMFSTDDGASHVDKAKHPDMSRVGPSLNNYDISPHDINKIIVVDGGNVFLSNDFGDTWTRVPVSGVTDFWGVHWDETGPCVIYAVSRTKGVYCSTDCGLTWTLCTGMGMAGLNPALEEIMAGVT